MKKYVAYLLMVLVLFSCSDDDAVINLAEVEILNVGEIITNMVSITSKVTSQGGTTVQERGICWSTSPNPTVNDNVATDESAQTQYITSINNLEVNQSYYIRAYVVNSAGTAYSEQEELTTNLPEVTTGAITNITTTTIDVGAEVTNVGSSAVSTRGICWSTSPNPTINDSNLSIGEGLGIYTGTLADLMAETTYYIRAYATSNLGTTYGNEIEFNDNLPVVTTTEITNIMIISAESGGEVTDEGGSSVITRGICWSTEPNPTIDTNNTTDGSGMGIFTSSITNIIENETYYVRAYATNGSGTSYGNEIQFINRDCIDNSDTFLDGYVQVHLVTQEEVNNYNYNSAFRLHIGSEDVESDITDLTPLLCLTDVRGGLIIQNNPGLISLTGLENIQEPLGITIENNQNLTSLTGLENLTRASLRIRNNPSLLNLDALNIETLGAYTYIQNNASLTSINLQSVTTSAADSEAYYYLDPYTMFIEDNPSLTTVNISNMTGFAGGIIIENNSSLNTINMASVNRLTHLLIKENYQLTNLNFDSLERIRYTDEIYYTASGVLHISDTQLTSIDVFPSLQNLHLGSLVISRNNALVDLVGVSTSSMKIDAVYIGENPLITNLDGLTFNTINSSSNKLLYIIGNDALTNIDELNVYASSGYKFREIIITDNPILTNIDILSPVDYCVEGGLRVRGNLSLTNLCGLMAFANNYIENQNLPYPDEFCYLEISGNAYNPSAQDIVDGNCSQ